jgi:hypothetical protein
MIPDFHENFDPLDDKYEIKYLTDQYCKLGTEDTRKAFYNCLKAGVHCLDIDSETELDVITRCRLLRNLGKHQASRMIHAMATVINKFLDQIQPKLVFTHMVDEYILHLFSIITTRRNIAYAAYCGSYFPGHALIFKNGNGIALPFRLPENTEVENIFDQISPTTFRQNFRQIKHYSLWQHLRLMSRYTAKKIIFPIKSIIESDPWGMHYKIVSYCADRRRLSDFPSHENFVGDWSAKLEKMVEEFPGKPIIYLPLSYFPEATTDYWVENTCLVEYENKIVEIIKALSQDCLILVKEHAHMMGARPVYFHQVLNSLNSVMSIHPDIIGNEVLLRSDAVVVGSGSVGVEAFLRDKPVFSYCDTSYWFALSKANYLDLNHLSDWSIQIKKSLSDFMPANKVEKKQFIFDCLKFTMRTKPGGKRWPLLQTDDLELLLDSLLTS